MIDAGMSDSYGGHRTALEIDKEGAFLALYPDAAPQTLPALSAAR